MVIWITDYYMVNDYQIYIYIYLLVIKHDSFTPGPSPEAERAERPATGLNLRRPSHWGDGTTMIPLGHEAMVCHSLKFLVT